MQVTNCLISPSASHFCRTHLDALKCVYMHYKASTSDLTGSLFCKIASALNSHSLPVRDLFALLRTFRGTYYSANWIHLQIIRVQHPSVQYLEPTHLQAHG